jgi:hypothetical protein
MDVTQFIVDFKFFFSFEINHLKKKILNKDLFVLKNIILIINFNGGS